jgi:hypothetical protein
VRSFYSNFSNVSINSFDTTYVSGNLFSITFVLVEGALRAPSTASPPLNMHKALIFNGVFIMLMCTSVFFIRGTQVRRENDVRMGQEREERGMD